jgi:hypothetical protein
MNQANQGQKPSEPRAGDQTRRNYLIGAVIVWVAIIAASSFILAGTPYLGQMLPILGGGAAWFVVIVPGALLRTR